MSPTGEMSRRGFTLLELLVVLAIGALLLGLGVEQIGHRTSAAKLGAATREAVAELRHARTRAVAENRVVTVTIDAAQGRILTDRASRAREFARGTVVQLINAPTGMDANSTPRIRFYGDGSSSGGEIRISLKEQQRRILVARVDGKVRLDD